jgi:threonine dehydrogenase-like Zn-dependent dehydrogenase
MRTRVPWLTDVRTIEYREQELTLGPAQVLVKHVCTAPSQGTALHMYRGDHLDVEFTRRTRPWPYPWLQGFAYGVGRVEEVGAQVTGIEPGQLVYSMKLLGEHAVLAPTDLTPLPPGLDAEPAALAFQAGVALNGIQEAQVALGDVVLVTGQGPIGNFAAQLCRLAGAWRVVTTDMSETQLAISRRVGADLALHAASGVVTQQVQALSGGRGADLCVEASGSPRALLPCADAARRMGRIAVIGWVMHAVTINLAQDFTPKGLEMVVCHAGRGGGPHTDLRRRAGMSGAELERQGRLFLLDLMRQGRLKAGELITHRFPLRDLRAAAEFLDTRAGEYCQTLLVSE